MALTNWNFNWRKTLKIFDSVTAAKTVKAGGATMGGQTVNNAAGDSETGNYRNRP